MSNIDKRALREAAENRAEDAEKRIAELGMVISRDGFGNHQASIIITDFPGQKSPEEAALKLADWLKRLGESIEANFKKPEVRDA